MFKRLKKAKKRTKVVEQSGSSDDEDDKVLITDDANQTLNHQKQVQASKVSLDNFSEFEPFFLANKYTTERHDLMRQTDIPERMHMIEEIARPPPLDKRSIEEETIWIHNQLVMNSYILFCKKRTEERSVEVFDKEYIMRFLELHHVEKFDVPFIAMHRKEQCPSLLDDFE
ncbi:hypothetical protein J1N35_008315 [Gossypium stocksii]|uniref:Uncharacterized protein n=1 Tax=Gossypium stocksii TaxID=47602 RepID=A0A9D3W8M2_9ROSI|nr:hypothetical protein J1N35_008315 [Gossypium stocksii]